MNIFSDHSAPPERIKKMKAGLPESELVGSAFPEFTTETIITLEHLRRLAELVHPHGIGLGGSHESRLPGIGLEADSIGGQVGVAVSQGGRRRSRALGIVHHHYTVSVG